MTANSTKTPEPTDPGNRLCPRDRPRTRHEQHQARHRPREGEVGEDPTKTPKPRQAATVADGNAKPERKPRTDTRQAQLITMLRGKDGATVEEIAGAFGWQAQNGPCCPVRALKKKLGLDNTSRQRSANWRTLCRVLRNSVVAAPDRA